jgi:hypothetical protein
MQKIGSNDWTYYRCVLKITTRSALVYASYPVQLSAPPCENSPRQPASQRKLAATNSAITVGDMVCESHEKRYNDVVKTSSRHVSGMLGYLIDILTT